MWNLKHEDDVFSLSRDTRHVQHNMYIRENYVQNNHMIVKSPCLYNAA